MSKDIRRTLFKAMATGTKLKSHNNNNPIWTAIKIDEFTWHLFDINNEYCLTFGYPPNHLGPWVSEE